MADPYWNYSAPPPERVTNPRHRYPGHLPSDVSTLTTQHQLSSDDIPGSSDFLQKDFQPSHPSHYGINGMRGMYPESAGGGGVTSGISKRGYPSPPRDPSFLRQGRDVTPGISPSNDGRIRERAKSLKRDDGLPVAAESNLLFVDGLPTDCSRREVGHLFRPFVGFKDLKVVHKEPRRSGDKAAVLCFVEFADARCAHTAMEALHGYKFDDRKPDSLLLKIYPAHFPFRLPSDQDDQQFGSARQS